MFRQSDNQADGCPTSRLYCLQWCCSSHQRPHITVGLSGADIVGADNRALQAAVDYIAGLGGGTVEIGPGEFMMHDSLHLRSFVTVRGIKGKTILRKAKAASSPLALDGDYGEEQITVANAEGFEVGASVA